MALENGFYWVKESSTKWTLIQVGRVDGHFCYPGRPDQLPLERLEGHVMAGPLQPMPETAWEYEGKEES